jgi:branched-chain amino acid transport system permease protein
VVVNVRPPVDDAERIVYDRFYRAVRARLIPLVRPDLIEEHRDHPRGQHSADLERILHYFRSGPARGKYVIVCTKPHAEYCIGVLSGRRGDAPRVSEDERFPSVTAAEHGVFERRLQKMMEESV